MPVDIATGLTSLEFDDIEVPGRAPLRWNHRYSVGLVDRVQSPLGRGWFNEIFCTLHRVQGGYVHTDANGAEELFEDPDDIVIRGGVLRKLGAYKEFYWDGARYVVRSWDVTTGEVRALCFGVSAEAGATPRLTAIEDVFGDGVDVLWLTEAGGPRPVALRQRVEGRELRISYDRAGWLSRVDLRTPDGAEFPVVAYEHDAIGQVTGIVDGAGFADRFAYDERGRVTREMAKDGGVFHYRYDANDRCVYHSGLDRYNERRLRYLPGVGVTEVTNSYGNTTVYRHLPSGQIVAEGDAVGGQRSTEYDEHGRVVAITDGNGAVTSYAYDGAGNRSLVVDPLGNETRRTFNERHQPVEMIDPAGGVWRREYDARGRLLRAVEPLGGAWSYRYDAEGNLVELRNPAGASRSFTYWNGVLRSATDWMGNVTEYGFDAFGRETMRRGPQGDATQVRYDHAGNPVEVRLPDGTAVAATYDVAGNPTSHVDAAGHTTRWRYGTCRRLLERIDPAGNSLRLEWGTEPGTLDRLINPKGEVYTFERDAAGRVVAETPFDGVRREYRLDAEGRTVAYVNGNGETLEMKRDPLGRIVDQLLPDGEQLHYAYDALGQLQEAISGDIALAYERDALGRVLREVQGERWVESRYDAAGGLVGVRSSENYAIDYLVDANLRTVGYDVAGRSLRLARDASGLETERTLPDGARLLQGYDAMGRLRSQELVRGRGNGRVGANPIQRRYEYSPAGRLVEARDARWGRADFVYDPIDQLLEALRERGPSERFAYDPDGNIRRIQASGDEARDERLEYGPGDRLLREGDTRFEYDAEGRCTRKIEGADGPAPRVWRFEWNGLDRLKRVTRPDGTVWQYRYDALARRVAKVRDGVVAAEYLWDRDVIAQELLPGRRNHSWLWQSDEFAPVATLQQGRLYTVVTDPSGTPRELVDESGVVVRALLLDSWGEVAESEVSNGAPVCDIRFQGQWLDAETGLHYNFFRYYNPAVGRYLSTDPLGLDGDTNAFRYTRNPFDWVDPLGLCNGNSSRARRAQHGYEIVDTHNGNVVVKTGVSGQPLNQNGSSPRANNQVNRWNNEPGNTGRYQARVAHTEPAGPKARQNILTWEQGNANKHRATLDPNRHRRP